jgi:hypothetical protein
MVLTGAPLIFPGITRIFRAAFNAASSKYPGGSAERMARTLSKLAVSKFHHVGLDTKCK